VVTRRGSSIGPLVGSWLLVLLVSLPVVLTTFGQGRKDWQYQLAGLADPFLGRPAPGLTIMLGASATVLLVVGAWIVGAVGRRIDPHPVEHAAPPRFRARWWFVLVAAWAAYGFGIASVAAAGASVDLAGTMRMAFGRPIGATIEVPATCRTAVGAPDVVAEVQPNAEGLHQVILRNVATGERNRFPEPTGVTVALVGDRSAATAYPLPNLPDRPLPYIEMTLGDGRKETEPAIGFLAAYDYLVSDVEANGLSGIVHVEGTRFPEPFGGGTGPGSIRWVNLEIPNDPWPTTLPIRIEWICQS
jgi:hypothetical protein